MQNRINYLLKIKKEQLVKFNDKTKLNIIKVQNDRKLLNSYNPILNQRRTNLDYKTNLKSKNDKLF